MVQAHRVAGGKEVVHAAEGRIHIPMATGVESLNAASAATVVLYEAYRQRAKKG